MGKKNTRRHNGRGGSRGYSLFQDQIVTGVPIVFQGQIIPGLTGEFEYRRGWPRNNLNAMFFGLSYRFLLRNEHAVVERIKTIFPDLFDTPNKVPQMTPISNQNFERQGYINYEIYDKNSQTFTSSPPPPPSPLINNTLAAIERARSRARTLDLFAEDRRAMDRHARDSSANNTPPISSVPSVTTNARIEPMVESNREQNILEIPIKFRGQVIPDVMAEVERSDGILGDIYYQVTHEHRRVREPEIYNKIHAMFPDTVNEELVAIVINIERGQQPEFLTYSTMRELNEAAEENWQRRLQRWRFAPANIYSNIPIVGERIVPENATNAITVEPFKVGNVMANFHGESGFGRYYSKNTFDKLRKKSITNTHKENPMTRQTIEPGNVTFYKKAATPEKTRKWWQFGKKKRGEEGSASQPKRKWWQFGKRSTRKENRKSRKTRKSRK